MGNAPLGRNSLFTKSLQSARRWSPVAIVQRRPNREVRPVAGRVPPARSDPFDNPPLEEAFYPREGYRTWGSKGACPLENPIYFKNLFPLPYGKG